MEEGILGLCNSIVEWIQKIQLVETTPVLQIYIIESVVKGKKRKRDKEEFAQQQQHETNIKINFSSGEWKKHLSLQDKNLLLQNLLQHILRPFLIVMEKCAQLQEKRFQIQFHCVDINSTEQHLLYEFPKSNISNHPGSSNQSAVLENYKIENSMVLKDKKSTLDIQVQVFELQEQNSDSSPYTILFGVKSHFTKVVSYHYISQPTFSKNMVLVIANEHDIKTSYLENYIQWLPRLYKAYSHQLLWQQKYAPTLSTCIMQVIQRASPSPFSQECMKLLQQQNKTLDELIQPLIPHQF